MSRAFELLDGGYTKVDREKLLGELSLQPFRLREYFKRHPLHRLRKEAIAALNNNHVQRVLKGIQLHAPIWQIMMEMTDAQLEELCNWRFVDWDYVAMNILASGDNAFVERMKSVLSMDLVQRIIKHENVGVNYGDYRWYHIPGKDNWPDVKRFPWAGCFVGAKHFRKACGPYYLDEPFEWHRKPEAKRNYTKEEILAYQKDYEAWRAGEDKMSLSSDTTIERVAEVTGYSVKDVAEIWGDIKSMSGTVEVALLREMLHLHVVSRNQRLALWFVKKCGSLGAAKDALDALREKDSV